MEVLETRDTRKVQLPTIKESSVKISTPSGRDHLLNNFKTSFQALDEFSQTFINVSIQQLDCEHACRKVELII